MPCALHPVWPESALAAQDRARIRARFCVAATRLAGWQNQLRYVLNRYDEHLAKLAGQKLNESQWGKIWEQDAASSIEHIAPQSSGVEWMHHLGNLTMLPPGTNSSLKAKPPVEKIDVYRSCGLIATIHVGHQIHDAESWTEDMVLARAQSIEDFIRLEWAD